MLETETVSFMFFIIIHIVFYLYRHNLKYETMFQGFLSNLDERYPHFGMLKCSLKYSIIVLKYHLSICHLPLLISELNVTIN